MLAQFYTHLTKDLATILPPKESKISLSLLLRDLLLKQVTLIGAPQVLMAMTPLAAAEGEPQIKAPQSELSEKWKDFSVQKIHDRGLDTIHTIYGQTLLHDRIFPMWGLHTRDIQFMELFTVYGLYLSDHTVLSAYETELVVFVTISCLGLGEGPALWHLRGLGRLLGARGADEMSEEMHQIKDWLRAVKTTLIAVIEFVGKDFENKARLETWPNVGDVTRVLGGWGEM